MKPPIVLVAILLIGNGLLVGMSVAEGYFLHWMMPSLEWNFSFLLGAIFTIATLFLFAQVAQFMSLANVPSDLIQGSDDDEDDKQEDDEEYEPRPPARFRRRPRRKR